MLPWMATKKLRLFDVCGLVQNMHSLSRRCLYCPTRRTLGVRSELIERENVCVCLGERSVKVSRRGTLTAIGAYVQFFAIYKKKYFYIS